MTVLVIKKSTEFERDDGRFHLFTCDVAVAETHDAAIKKMRDEGEFYLTDVTHGGGTVVKESDYIMQIITNESSRRRRITYNIYKRSTDEDSFI